MIPCLSLKCVGKHSSPRFFLLRKASKQMSANRHRFAGAPKRHRKPTVELSQEPQAPVRESPSADLHKKLRIALADGPLTFGQLRRSYELSPIVLLQDCIGKFPDVYIESVDAEGHPMIGLVDGAPPVEIIMERGPIIELIRQAAHNGVYLASLRSHTQLTSNRIEQLLEGVSGIDRVTRDRRVLFRVEPGQIIESQQPPVQESPADLEQARDQLIAIVGDSIRDVRWIEENFVSRPVIRRVLEKFGEDFEVGIFSNTNKNVSDRFPTQTRPGNP